MQEALGLGQAHGGLLKEFIAQDKIKPFISNDLAMEFLEPVRFNWRICERLSLFLKKS